MEELEDFISKNKKVFDSEEPDAYKIWSAIEKGLPSQTKPKTKTFSLKRLSMAAAFIVLCLCSGIVFLNQNNNDMLVAQQNDLNDINSYYSQLIGYKITKVKSSQGLSEQEKQEFFNYLNELDKERIKLENDLMQNVDNEEVLSAIVDNYRQRLHVLENILQRISRSKIKEDEGSISL